jgi:KEOPS complex subunit Cgi121
MKTDTMSCEIRAATCRIDDKAAFLDRLKEVSGQTGTHIICFNADMLAGKRHADAAVRHAIRSFRSRNAISNSLEMEALLYAAGSRQCNVGISFGIHEGENRLWVCCYPDSQVAWTTLAPVFAFPNNEGTWSNIDIKKRDVLMDLFRISREELDTLEFPEGLTDLVLERVALLEVIR